MIIPLNLLHGSILQLRYNCKLTTKVTKDTQEKSFFLISFVVFVSFVVHTGGLSVKMN
jgi:hypothetical protein